MTTTAPIPLAPTDITTLPQPAASGVGAIG